MKKCSVEGCNNEISQWQVLCKSHYEESLQKQGVVEEPPKIPSHKVTMPPQQAMQVGKVQEPPKFIETQEGHEELSVKDRLEIRQVCLRCAIDLITKTEFEDRTFDTLRGEIETLTEEFYLIVTKK